jgi:hypothetical protein
MDPLAINVKIVVWVDATPGWKREFRNIIEGGFKQYTVSTFVLEIVVIVGGCGVFAGRRTRGSRRVGVEERKRG